MKTKLAIFLTMLAGIVHCHAQWVEWPVSAGGNGHHYLPVAVTSPISWNQARDAATARRFLRGGATLVPVGLALSAVGHPEIGATITLVAMAVLVAGVHTFGRAGPDPGE